ncbi:MAG: lipoprotein insertase outer membrane protein LolB, partial [Woeseiaceae bacterium]|nr:lipoprotein insertase outer membrane protein LolB [Woeseiaceae bacterium]
DLPDLGEWETRQAVLAALDRWDFNGRVGVQAGDDGFNGKLRWRQDGDEFQATVSGPLGIGTVRIERRGDDVYVTDKDGETTALTDVEAELWYRYGWTIPVESLRFWVLGIPDPRVPAETQLGDEGRLLSLSQRGWDVVVSGYREVGGQQMPKRMTAISAETHVRLVIDDWVFR